MEEDTQVSINKTEELFTMSVMPVLTKELGGEQVLSGILAGYVEVCKRENVDFLQFFMAEFGMEYHVEDMSEGEAH